jgi:hypothetical protein
LSGASVSQAQFPHRIALDPDDYHARNVGRSSQGHQVLASEPFVPAKGADPGREFFAIYLFDSAGMLLDARIDDLGPRGELDLEYARRLCEERLAALGGIAPQRIEFRPFEIERFGFVFGLVPRPPDDADEVDDFDNWWVEAQPGNYMAFHAPWDSGEYDT